MNFKIQKHGTNLNLRESTDVFQERVILLGAFILNFSRQKVGLKTC